MWPSVAYAHIQNFHSEIVRSGIVSIGTKGSVDDKINSRKWLDTYWGLFNMTCGTGMLKFIRRGCSTGTDA